MANEQKDKKEFLGMPMNWEANKILKTMWNKDSDELFPPKAFGIGWTVNFHAVLRKAGLISKNKKSNKKDKE